MDVKRNFHLVASFFRCVLYLSNKSSTLSFLYWLKIYVYGCHTFLIHICYLPAGRSVFRKPVPEVLNTAQGRMPRAVLKTEGTVFPNTERPRPANNLFTFFCEKLVYKKYLC